AIPSPGKSAYAGGNGKRDRTWLLPLSDRKIAIAQGRSGVVAPRREGGLAMRRDLPVWRSMLFVPVTQRRFVKGAARRSADAIILDLEDAIAALERDRARTLVTDAAEIVSRGGADVVVRINRPNPDDGTRP